MLSVLILGQGISGTLLAAELISAGCSITIADPEIQSTSSRVAAGMIHPVTGRRIAKSWRVDEFLPVASELYLNHEQFLGKSFYHALPTLELFQDQQHYNEWMSKGGDASFHSYLGELCSPEFVPDGIEPGLGGQFLLKGGWLNTEAWLNAWKDYFKTHQQYLTVSIAENEFHFSDSGAKYKDELYNIVVDCRGHQSSQGNWFNYLPFNPAKGEVIRFRCKGLNLDSVIHKSIKIIPAGNDEFICGATFSWHQIDNVPTEEGKTELETKLKRVLKLPYQIISHKAGVRPATRDRRPFIGKHPGFERLYILNGLGAKGVLTGPAMAKQLCNLIINNTKPDDEVNISRFN